MSRGSITAIAVAVAAIAIGVTGCGGGDDGNEVTTSSLSKAEFIRKADAACAKGQSQVERDFNAFTKRTHFKLRQISRNPTKEQVNELVNTVVIPAVKREIAEIRALGAPRGDEDHVEAFLKAAEEGITTAQELPRKVLEETSIAFGVAGRLAKEYGLAVCGQH